MIYCLKKTVQINIKHLCLLAIAYLPLCGCVCQSSELRVSEDITGKVFYVWGDFYIATHDTNGDVNVITIHDSASVRSLIAQRGGILTSTIGPNVDYVILGSPNASSEYMSSLYSSQQVNDRYYRIYRYRWDRHWNTASEHDILVISLQELCRRMQLPYVPSIYQELLDEDVNSLVPSKPIGQGKE